MGLRTRLRGGVRRILGLQKKDEPTPTPDPVQAPVAAAPASVAPAAPEPTLSVVNEPAPATASTPSPTTAAPAPAEPNLSVVPDPVDADEEAKKQAKIARHFEKTRRGVLRHISNQGGSAGLGEMHDYSERRFFVAHKRFSDLMESLIDDGLISYDHAEGVAQITPTGLEYING